MQETQMPSILSPTNALLLVGCIVICVLSPSKWATLKRMVIGFFATAAITIVIGWFLFAASELALFVAALIGLRHIRSLKKGRGAAVKVAK